MEAVTTREITLDEIKAFAHSQLGSDNAKVSVSDGEFDIVDPWRSITPEGTELSDRAARDYWGDDLVDEFVAKAKEYLESQR